MVYTNYISNIKLLKIKKYINESSVKFIVLSTIPVSMDDSFPSSVKGPTEDSVTHLPTMPTESTNVPTMPTESTNVPTMPTESTNVPTMQTESTNVPTMQTESINVPTMQTESTNVQLNGRPKQIIEIIFKQYFLIYFCDSYQNIS